VYPDADVDIHYLGAMKTEWETTSPGLLPKRWLVNLAGRAQWPRLRAVGAAHVRAFRGWISGRVRSRTSGSRVDPVAFLLFSLAAANAVVLLADGGALRGFAAMLLVVVLPGTSIALAAYGRVDARLAFWGIVTSLGIIVVAGLVLDALPGRLGAGRWLLAIDLVTVAPLLVAASAPASPSWPALHPYLNARSLFTGSVLLLAAGLASVGVVLAVRGARTAERAQSFVQVWAVPHGSRLAVGVRSGEDGKPRTYRVALSSDGRTVKAYRFSLQWGDVWRRTVALPKGKAVYRIVLSDSTGRELRSLRIAR
jgi:hypothetical protein